MVREVKDLLALGGDASVNSFVAAVLPFHAS